MKKKYTLSLLLIFVTSFSFSQKMKIKSTVEVPLIEYTALKTTACIDTIRYPQTKTTGVEADTIAAGLREGAAQYYFFSGTGIVHGISAYMLLDFDGIPGNTDSVQLMAKVMKVNAFNEPITLIDSSLVTIYDVGYQEQALMFDAPVSITDSFAVALEIPAGFNDTLFYTSNSSVNLDGAGEGLASIAYQGIWYNYYMRGWGWDVDILMSPIFEQTFNSVYNIDTNRVCLGNEVFFENNTSYTDNTMFMTASNNLSLNFGDGDSSVIDTNLYHQYLTSGDYTTSLTLNHYGYYNVCSDVSNIEVFVLDSAMANFGYTDTGGGTIMFSDSSLNAASYSWDFGDGSPTSSLSNPTHTYSTPGPFNVCLSVTDTNGCNTNTFCQEFSVIILGVEETNQEGIQIYPNPASKYVNVSVPVNFNTGNVVVTDIVGKKIKNIEIHNQSNITISTHDVNSGVYFVSVENSGQKIFTKRILIDK